MKKELEDQNYRDGDFMSSLEAGYGKEMDSLDDGIQYVYNSPKTQFIVDDKGRNNLAKDNKPRNN